MKALAPTAFLLAVSTVPLAAADLKWRPVWEIPQADFRLKLTGYLMQDFSAYPNWSVEEGERIDSHELERARLGFELKWRRLQVEFDVDAGDDEERLKDLFVDFEIRKHLSVQAGNFKPPFSREFRTPPRRLDFIRRSVLAEEAAPRRDLGVMVHGEFLRRLDYAVGVFAGDGRDKAFRADTTVAARVVVKVTKQLDVGASFTAGNVRADPAAEPAPDPHGLRGKGPTGFIFFDRHYVNGSRRRWDVEAAYEKGRVTLKTEVLRATEERLGQGSAFDDLPDVVSTGWAVSGIWLVSGDKRKKTIELSARYESLRFDDAGADRGFSGAGDRARNIRPAGDRVLTTGVSWWPSAWVRLMGNLVLERYEDPLLAPEPQRAGNYVSLLARIQVQIP